MEIMDTYLEQLLNEGYRGVEYAREVMPCFKMCRKQMQMGRKAAAGFVLAGPLGHTYAEFFSKSGKLNRLCVTKCSINLLNKLIRENHPKADRFKRELIKDIELLKKLDFKVDQLMLKLQSKGKTKAYMFVKRHYDQIIAMR